MFPLPTLPTDNLYKLFFIGGLIMIILSVGLYITQYDRCKERLYSVRLAVLKKEAQIGNAKEQDDQLHAELSELKKQTNNTQKDTMHVADRSVLKELNEKGLNISTRLDAQANLYNEISFNMKELDLERERLIDEGRILTLVVVLSIFYTLLGSCMMFYGWQRWYVRVQRPTDEKLMIELQLLKKSAQAKETPSPSNPPETH